MITLAFKASLYWASVGGAGGARGLDPQDHRPPSVPFVVVLLISVSLISVSLAEMLMASAMIGELLVKFFIKATPSLPPRWTGTWQQVIAAMASKMSRDDANRVMLFPIRHQFP